MMSTSYTKKITIVSLGLLMAITLTGCGGAKDNTTISQTSGTTQEDNLPTQEAQVTNTFEYINKEKGFTLTVPSEWTFQENIYGSIVILFAPQETGDTTKENLGITSEELTVNVNLDTYYELTKANLENVISDFKFGTKEDISIDGNKAFKITYEGTLDQKKIQREQIGFIKGKTAYVMTYTAISDSFNTFLQEVNDIINSFKFSN